MLPSLRRTWFYRVRLFFSCHAFQAALFQAFSAQRNMVKYFQNLILEWIFRNPFFKTRPVLRVSAG